ncbi:MAG: TonB family protein [Luteibaculaceae bacterium]|jgi:TonB family protein
MPVLHRWFNSHFWILFFVLFHLNGNAQIKKSYVKRYAHLLDSSADLLEMGRQKSVEKKGDTLIVKCFHPENILLISAFKGIPNSDDSLVLTGASEKWFSTGELASKIFYRNGLLHGEWIKYHPFSDQIGEKGRYRRNKKEGTWMVYYENGSKKVQEYFKSGQLHGTQSFFGDNGEIVFTVDYDEGSLLQRNVIDSLGYRRFKEFVLPVFGQCLGLGGSAAQNCSNRNLFSFLQANLSYPRESIRFNDQGTVEVTFIINELGGVQDVAILYGVSYHLDEKAKSIASELPNWKPGSVLREPKKVRYNLPIRFSFKE